MIALLLGVYGLLGPRSAALWADVVGWGLAAGLLVPLLTPQALRWVRQSRPARTAPPPPRRPG